MLFLLAFVAALVLFWLFRHRSIKSASHALHNYEPDGPLKATTQNIYSNIKPVASSDPCSEEPLCIRPLKPKYHLTMALETISLSDLVLMDKTYLSRIGIRRDFHQRHGRQVVNCNSSAIPAVREFYTWMATIYLPSRFPTVFKSTATEKASMLQNLMTGENIPTDPDEDPLTALRTLSSQVDTDFLFLLPTSSTDTPPYYPGPNFHPSSHSAPPAGASAPSAPSNAAQNYHLHAYAGCFPSGFNWLDKFSKPLAAIHAPAVPHYGEKLERSMDRFFATLPPGKIVSRRNWAITTDRELFKPKGNHGDASGEPESEERAKEKERQRSEVDLSQTVLRCERQTLHRLPETGALVFGFKTYQYELADIKEEGNGLELADAIEGLAKGSAPRAFVYKRADIWGDKVCEYLRS